MIPRTLLSSVLLTALLIGPVHPERAAIGQGPLILAPTSRVKVHHGAELTLSCGDRESTGVVQYWHTPFGQLHRGIHDYLDPVAMQHDGSLVIANTSHHHNGLYYCLLQDIERMTLRSYQIHTGQNLIGQLYQGDQEDKVPHQTDNVLELNRQNNSHTVIQQASDFSAGLLRLRRSAVGPGSEGERQADISDGQFAGAVVASVVVTFLVGFSAGALSRSPVLRCVGAVTKRVRSPRQRRHPNDITDCSCEVSMATLPPMYENGAFRQEPGPDGEVVTTEMPPASPPIKPQRSFRHKQEKQVDITETNTYLEGCDYGGEKERGMKEERGMEERREGRREDSECQSEKEERRESEGEGEEERVGSRDSDEGEGCSTESERTSAETDGERRSREKEEEEEGRRDSSGGDGGEEVCPPTAPSPPARRSRVIRLYQYDEEGQRYSHLPSSASDDPGPTPRPKQRSLSLLRLNAIMAAASASPLEPTGREMEGKQGKEGHSPSPPTSPLERPIFHMDI